MIQIALIGIGAGAAAALLFASLASGSLFAILLVYLCPLPILIAGIGWNYLAGAIAALFATVSLALVLDGLSVLLFVVSFALPAWWLGYLALLARPTQGAAGEALEWYPVGRIVLWTAFIGAAPIALAILIKFGTDAEAFRSTLTGAIEAAGKSASGVLEREIPVEAGLLAKLLPPMVASAITIQFLVNTWLAARIVSVSGQLRRPWPELPALSLPRFAPILLAAALAGIFMPGMLGIISDIFAACLMVAFAVLGSAVLHVLTRGINARLLVLTGVYTAVVIFTWPAIILALLGLVDAALDLRGRAARTRGPPTLH
jgi:hypothetical protein